MADGADTDTPWWRSWTSWRPTLLMLAIVGVLVGLWFLLPEYPEQGDTSRSCQETPERAQLAPDEGVVPVPLILENSSGVVITFGRDRGVHEKTVYLQVDKRKPPEGQSRFATLELNTNLHVAERPLEREESAGTIGPARYVAVADVTEPDEVRLRVCADTTGTDIDPGTYSGSVRITGRKIQPATVPVEISLQYPGYRWIVPLFSVVTFIAGSFLVWASHKRAQPEPDDRSIWKALQDFPAWIADNYVGVAGGVIATVSVFIAKYWRSDPWGARAPEDWFALLGAMFTAYTTTLTAATAIVGPRRGGTQSNPGKPV